MPTTKSNLMRRVEAMENKPLEEILPKLFYELGHEGLVQRWGVGKSTITYWIYKFGFITKLILVKRGKGSDGTL